LEAPVLIPAVAFVGCSSGAFVSGGDILEAGTLCGMAGAESTAGVPYEAGLGRSVRTAFEPKSPVNLSTAGRTVKEAAAINEYAARSNVWLKQNGGATIRSTDGALRAEANAVVRAERLAAARNGTPYNGQAGHVPDTAVSGQAKPPAGWLDMPGVSNQVCGGVLASRIGELITHFTVDGGLPLSSSSSSSC
jgi:hypothetical protein